MNMAISHSTIPLARSARWDRFDCVLRVVVFVTVAVVVVGAMFGFAGLTTSTIAAVDGNLAVQIEHATVSRPGLATPLSIEVRSNDGRELPDRVTVELSRRYLDAFDENGLDPEPTDVSSDGTVERWTFQTGGHAVLAIDFDARLQPNIHSSRRTDVVVEAAGDRVTVPIETRVRP